MYSKQVRTTFHPEKAGGYMTTREQIMQLLKEKQPYLPEQYNTICCHAQPGNYRRGDQESQRGSSEFFFIYLTPIFECDIQAVGNGGS